MITKTVETTVHFIEKAHGKKQMKTIIVTYLFDLIPIWRKKVIYFSDDVTSNMVITV